METNGIFEGCFNEGIEEKTQTDQEPLKKCGRSVSSAAPTQSSGCFDCNICLDFVVDPVVTLCGHLYCWPCIYKWLQVETESESSQQCPVCKAPLSENALVPLYGRGHSTKHSYENIEIPRRPSRVRHQDNLDTGNHPMPVRRHGHQHYHFHHYPLGNDYLLSTGMTRMMHSTAGGVLGGLAFAVLPWVCRNHREEAASVHYESPLSVGATGGEGRLRLRRREIEVEMSMHHIWFFLFCCAVLCLLLF